MINLAPELALAMLAGLVSMLGSFFAVKASQAEAMRLLKALHARFDRVESRVARVETDIARQDERLKALKEQIPRRTTGRFAVVDDQDMFRPEDTGR